MSDDDGSGGSQTPAVEQSPPAASPPTAEAPAMQSDPAVVTLVVKGSQPPASPEQGTVYLTETRD